MCLNNPFNYKDKFDGIDQLYRFLQLRPNKQIDDINIIDGVEGFLVSDGRILFAFNKGFLHVDLHVAKHYNSDNLYHVRLYISSEDNSSINVYGPNESKQEALNRYKLSKPIVESMITAQYIYDLKYMVEIFRSIGMYVSI